METQVQPRLKIFGWLVFYKRILTAENLEKRGWHLPSMCVMCRCNCETIEHIFSTCLFALGLYNRLNQVFQLPQREWNTLLETQGAHKWVVAKGSDKKSREVMLIAIFIIWRKVHKNFQRDDQRNAKSGSGSGRTMEVLALK